MSHQYAGDDLPLFEQAKNWKRYLRAALAPYLRGRVLEVGAGIGGTTVELCSARATQWTALEPDAALSQKLRLKLSKLEAGTQFQVVHGTLDTLPPAAPSFDNVLYIDVLEHIERDEDELRAALRQLDAGGHIVVMSPAHNWLYSEFDRSVGHFRRYDAGSLRRLTPPGATLVRLQYLDSVGVAASAANRFLLRRQLPSEGQIGVWDRYMVPVSRVLDPLLRHRLGKSIVAVWRKGDGLARAAG